jgi:superfamily II RNA helicase
MSLLAKDTKSDIARTQSELDSANEKLAQGVNLKEEQLTQIREYYSRKSKVDSLKGNQWKKASLKLNDFKKQINQFQRIDSIYTKFKETEERVKKLKGQIEYISEAINIDTNKMLNYLYDNHYIDLTSPFESIPREQNQIKLTNKAENTSNITSANIKLALKGIIASQISECNEIILTEIVTNKFFLELDAAEIVAVLAAFIEEKANDVTEISKLNVSERVKQVLGDVSYIADDFGSYEYNSGIEIESDWQLYLSFIGPAYDWAKGKTIFEIYSEYPDVYEGTFIRNILRITNMIENIKNIAAMCNQPEIIKKLEGINESLMRDQVTTESLYISKQ